MRGWAVIVLVVVGCASCSTGDTQPSSPIAVLRAAARQSLATPSAGVRGYMVFPGDIKDPLFHGSVDLQKRRTAITVAAGQSSHIQYPPYEIRYVDGSSYIQIDRAAWRSPTLRPNAQWVVYRTQLPPASLPIPTQAIPPAYPVNALLWLINLPIKRATFADPPTANPRRVKVHFADSPFTYTYAIDRTGRIAVVSNDDPKAQRDTTLTFTYATSATNIKAPTAHVQHLRYLRPAP